MLRMNARPRRDPSFGTRLTLNYPNIAAKALNHLPRPRWYKGQHPRNATDEATVIFIQSGIGYRNCS